VKGSGTLTLGIMYALVGLGTGLGPIVARRFTGDSAPALVRAISIGFVTLSLSTIVLGVTHLLGVAFVSVSLRAVGSGIIWVFSSALLLGAVEDRFRGRVMAFEFLALTLMQSLGTIYGGIALDKLDWQVQQAIVAAGLVGLGFAVAWITVARKIRVHYQATSPVATELLS
jgi:MFS family permease